MPDGNETTEPMGVPWWLRLIFVVVGLGLWFGTQHYIGLREVPENGIGDTVLDLTAGVHSYLVEHSQVADILLAFSSFIIDALAIFLLAWSIFGPSIRPFLGLLILFGLRQLCQISVALPEPPGMIWGKPPVIGGIQIPSILVTYKVANDFFFSGHTALAIYGAVEIGRLGRRHWIALAWCIALFQAAVVIVLRAHWTMDVYAGAVTALLVAIVANWLAPKVDRFLTFRKPVSD